MSPLSEMPSWLVERLAKQPPPVPQTPSQSRHPSSLLPDTPGDWVRANLAWDDYLVKHGWTGMRNGYWCRPGKNPRDGHSAELHPDGRLAIWTGEVPDALRQLGKQQSDGGISISLYDFIAAYEFAGDRAACGSHVRLQMMPMSAQVPPAGSSNSLPAVPSEPDDTPTTLIHPPEFWSQLPLLAHIRDAAWSMGACPDAQLHAWLAHYATAIPPQYGIPAMVGDESSFDLLTVLVGPSGAKKSSTMRRAEHLTPLTQRKDLQIGLDISSGEGIIDAYYDLVADDPSDPKSKPVRKKAYAGICFKVDEGKVISDLNQRQGTTHTSRLCTAWSGGTLSTPNATTERKRLIQAGTYRLTAVVAAQEKYAVAFLTGDSALQGFAQRLLWAWCVDPNKPDPDHRPAEPGPLGSLAPIPPSVGYKLMEYHPDIIREVMWADHELRYPDPLDAHRMLLTVKVAGILALATGQSSVGLDMWAIAHQVVAKSVEVRSHVLATARATTQRDFVDMAQRKGVAAALQSEALDKHILGDTIDIIAAKLKQQDLTRGDLRKALTPSKKPYVDEALAVLEGTGKVAGGNGQKWHWK